MVYRIQLFKFFTSIYDHIFRIRQAERISNLWKTSILLIAASIVLYGWMGYLGIGTTILSSSTAHESALDYETSKYWFMLGRMVYGALFAGAVLFIPGLIFHLITGIPYQKLVIMQQIVLAVMLLERLIWIPLVLFVGIEWYVSPLSFGIIASYLIEIDWFIYFFGAITLFQLWIIWFQFRFLHTLSKARTLIIVTFVLLVNILGWVLAASLAVADTFIISGWFE